MQDLFQMLSVAFLLPLALSFALSGCWRKKQAYAFAALATVLLCLNFLALHFAPMLGTSFTMLQDLRWNWPGKIAAIICSFIVVLCFPQRLREKTGVFNLPRFQNWKVDLFIFLQLIVFFVIVNLFDSECSRFDGETILFQAFMPGLDEEIFFRGVLLLLLNEAFGTPWRIGGIRLGWGALPVVAFFGLAHGYAAGAEMKWFIVFATGYMGISLLWLRERTQSVWLAVLGHNLANVLGQWASACS